MRYGTDHLNANARALGIVIAFGIALVAPRLGAQSAALPGRLTERTMSGGDTAQAFAAYIPASYDPSRRTPVLFVLDPRGRALDALSRFAPAAERAGWVVVSSYASRSDGAGEPNVTAMNTMLDWAQREVRVDSRRLYLAGLSGTARAAWTILQQFRPNVAGIIAAGATVPIAGTEAMVAGDASFAVYALAGTTDFNYEEVRTFDDRLGAVGVPHRVAWFDGPHAWPPAADCGRAVAWMERRAMLGGRRAVDSGAVRDAFRADLTRADSLDRAGQWDAAEVLASSTARDGAGWAEGDSARHRVAVWRARPALRVLREALRKSLDKERGQQADIERVLAWERAEADPPDARDLLKRLDVPSLQRAAGTADSVTALSARRRLARMQAMLGFYAPRERELSGHPAHAARLREAAAAITVSSAPPAAASTPRSPESPAAPGSPAPAPDP